MGATLYVFLASKVTHGNETYEVGCKTYEIGCKIYEVGCEVYCKTYEPGCTKSYGVGLKKHEEQRRSRTV